MVSHQYKCIFIHIPKTAGTSVEHALGYDSMRKRNLQDHRSIQMFEPCYLPQIARNALRGDILPLKKYIRHRVKGRQFVSAQQYQSYFKFAFVRNPWARVFSWYRNVMHDEIHRRTYHVAETCSFDEYVRQHLDTWTLQPQMDWLTDSRGQIAMDFVGRYETLAEDFAHVSEVLGLQNTPLPHVNVGHRADYRACYNDETKALVARKYAEEIERFKFVFGEES